MNEFSQRVTNELRGNKQDAVILSEADVKAFNANTFATRAARLGDEGGKPVGISNQKLVVSKPPAYATHTSGHDDLDHFGKFSAFEKQEYIDDALLKIVAAEPLVSEGEIFKLVNRECAGRFSVSRGTIRKAFKRTDMANSFKRFRFFIAG